MNPEYCFVIPFISGLLSVLGGRNFKLFRRLGIGLMIGAIALLMTHNWLSLACIGTYYAVTYIGYGKLIEDKNYLLLVLLGASYGLAALPVAIVTSNYTPLIAQVIIACTSWTLLVFWANWESIPSKYRIGWPMVEGLTWLFATIFVPRMLMG